MSACSCHWAQREEIFKTSCIPQLISLLERGQEDERHGACGAICALAQSEKHITEIINHRVRGRVLLGFSSRETRDSAEFW
jgi:hypothetical protein